MCCPASQKWQAMALPQPKDPERLCCTTLPSFMSPPLISSFFCFCFPRPPIPDGWSTRPQDSPFPNLQRVFGFLFWIWIFLSKWTWLMQITSPIQDPAAWFKPGFVSYQAANAFTEGCGTAVWNMWQPSVTPSRGLWRDVWKSGLWAYKMLPSCVFGVRRNQIWRRGWRWRRVRGVDITRSYFRMKKSSCWHCQDLENVLNEYFMFGNE